MGYLKEGKWIDKWYDTKSTNGKFKRSISQFRQSISNTDDTRFKVEKNRYHLYVSYACPWAHRTLIMRALKGLEDIISYSAVDAIMKESGWTFGTSSKDRKDPVNGFKYLYEVYLKSSSSYEGRVTVPILWDKKTHQIVNNESSEIIRILNTEFNEFGNDLDFYPKEHEQEINELNDYIYENINNGVYKSGFATSQNAYEDACKQLFQALDKIDRHLAKKTWLCGDKLTEADIRLFPTILRFDAVYVSHFKCSLKQIRDYPNISRHMQQFLKMNEIKHTVNMTDIKTHYYASHDTINPTGIIPLGPDHTTRL